MAHLGEFEQLILFAIYHLGDDAYGIAIRDFIEARTGRVPASGAIYTALSRLEERGLVAAAGASAPSGPGRPRKHYRLQPEGARSLVEAYETMSAMARGALPGLTKLAEG